MPDPDDKLPEELKPGSVKGWASIHGESVIQTSVVQNPEEAPKSEGFKVTDPSKVQMITLSPPTPNPFETHGTIYSNGSVFERQYGIKYDPLVSVSEGRTRLIVNLETLRKNPRCLQLVIELLYASLRP
jgi:hypothetical protein